VGHREAQATTPTADPADQWRLAVTAVLRAESEDPGRCGASIVCRAVLDVLAATPGLGDPHFGDAAALDRLPIRDRVTVPYAFRRGLLPEAGAAEVLAECGALNPATRTLTPLGRWARPRFTQPLAVPRTTWADNDALKLRIDLDRFQPPVWRRVRLPATTTLAELHRIIQVLFEWEHDHLHVFTVDGGSGRGRRGGGGSRCRSTEAVTGFSAPTGSGASGGCMGLVSVRDRALGNPHADRRSSRARADLWNPQAAKQQVIGCGRSFGRPSA
jgi:Plasmid pRiA4b ORF-3-like protein